MQFVFFALFLFTVIGSITSLPQLQGLGSIFDEGNSTDNSRGNLWAVLVTGSRGYRNYRYQADVLHAYQLLISRGVPRKHIITMMYGDIPYSKDNPFPGEVYNVPDGHNVYNAVNIDYRREEVTAQTFLGVLTANRKMIEEGKPVLRSTKKDNVFIFFADEGGLGTFSFPEEFLFADQLLKALGTMHSNEMYNKMAIYVEGSKSGSMFENLPSSHNIFVLAASNNLESSYACFHNQILKTFMGNCFSISWIVDSDEQYGHRETLQKQHDTIYRRSKSNYVSTYGATALMHDTVGNYHGTKLNRIRYNSADDIKQIKSEFTTQKASRQENAELIPLIAHFKSAQGSEKKRLELKIRTVYERRSTFFDIVKKIGIEIRRNGASPYNSGEQSNQINFECYRPLVIRVREKCSHIIDFGSYNVVRHFYKFNNICEWSLPMGAILRAVDKACRAYH